MPSSKRIIQKSYCSTGTKTKLGTGRTEGLSGRRDLFHYTKLWGSSSDEARHDNKILSNKIYYHQQVRTWVQVHNKMIPRCYYQLQVARRQWTKRTYECAHGDIVTRWSLSCAHGDAAARWSVHDDTATKRSPLRANDNAAARR